MATWPARAVRVVLYALVLGALVVGAVSLGTALAATDDVGDVSAAPGLASADEHTEAEHNETEHNETEVNATSLEGYDQVKTTIALAENGSAEFSVAYRYRLDGNESTERWDELERSIDEDAAPYLAAESERWHRSLSAVRNETDREMNVSDFELSTDEESTPHQVGVVEFTFRWSGFAVIEPIRIEAGDALGNYVLDDDTELWISWPAEYEATTIEPEPDERRDSVVGWRGQETDFVEGEPRVSLLHEAEGNERTTDPEDFSVGWPFLAAGVLLVALVGIAAWLVGRPDRSSDDSPPGHVSEVGGPPPELLSNEERVLTLLADSGGRLKQQEVVATLEWTEAKTSQVVGRLREADEIEVLRVGRENVLVLSDDGSPDTPD